ncbi:di-trans,poly-cis-decaprenylcistransferase [Candidatus Jorgensenbacteria bacterium]|nr:di-trans,poly-cis-decaprenylcistransferase [Candidatus Jorgensenbacteria bacterium]
MVLPKHVAIIPDGNRRWAKRKKRPSYFGHMAGAKNTEKILRTALDYKIPFITFWGSSVANVTDRSASERKHLFDIFRIYFKRLLISDDIHKNKINVDIIGRWRELFPEATKKPMEEILKRTKEYQNYRLTFLMAYSGIDEMIEAFKKVVALSVKDWNKIDSSLIKNILWTGDLPPVDLVIRTGGEPHWSDGFMMWDVADAQLHFTETLWPDFSPQEFKNVLEAFKRTERRFGR